MAEIVDASASSPKVTYSTITTVIAVKDYGDGKYEISEIPSDEASFPDLHSANRQSFSFPLPIPGFAAVGYVDEGDAEIGLYFTFAGSQVGAKYSASLNNGLEVGVNLGLGKGSLRIFKDGSALKASYSITVGVSIFSKTFNDTITLLQL